MREQLRDKLIEISCLLRERGNSAYIFFEKLIREMDENNGEYIELIISASPIIQYGNFTYKEENLFKEIWFLANKLKSI